MKKSETEKIPQKKDYMIFNIIWSFVFLVIALFPLIKGNSYRLWSLEVSGAFLVIALIYPTLTKGFYKVWVKFGRVVSAVNSRIVTGILFYLIITPSGLLMRLFGKDLLKKKLDRKSKTYWENREVQPTSMKNQF